MSYSHIWVDRLERTDFVRVGDGTVRFVLESDDGHVSLSRCVECIPEIWTKDALGKSYLPDDLNLKYGNNDWESALYQWVQVKQ